MRLLTEWGFETPHTVACVRTSKETAAVTDMLFSRGGTYFCKPLDGQCGGGVFRLDTTVETNRDSVYERLSQGVYLVQTCVVQHPVMDRIYDKSVNTLRILTILDKETGKAISVAGEVRFGAHGSVCKKGGAKRTPCHPDSQVRFADVRIPFVQEAVNLAGKLHEKLSSIRVIGWDIAITSDGPVFIEGNDNPEISGLQTVNGGLKQTIQSLLKNEFNN